MKIAMVASEANPIAKTGGLADVVYALSEQLVKLDCEVMVIMPFYSHAYNSGLNLTYVCDYFVDMSWRHQKVEVFSTIIDGITYYLIKNDYYFNRGHLYGDYDDGERFAYFTLASKKLFEHINYHVDIIHIHDWQVGMLPCLIKEEKPISNVFINTKFVLTIHNPAFQGMFNKFVLGDLYNLSDELFYNGKVEFFGNVSTLKTAIIYCDKITTVSPTHREELLSKDGSKGLDVVLKLREYDFAGFLNGIDVNEFNPRDDKKIIKNYNLRNYKSSKKENKKYLIEKFNLKDPNRPLFTLVSRLTWQKGIDILIPTCYELVRNGANIIILGSGEYNLEQGFEVLRGNYPDNVGIYIGYNDELAHQIYAAGDYFLMPSLFEPCGIGQMIAQRYGNLPIVRRTGGLKDSVIGYDLYNIDVADGFAFDDYNYEALKNTCLYALSFYNNEDVFNKLIKNALKVDHSWLKSAKLYLGLYQDAIKNK